MEKTDLVFYYPRWIRKAVTFTIDDGNVDLDKKFISYVKPAGIKGTFNLIGTYEWPREAYYEQYAEYGVANHVKRHPKLFKESDKALIVNKVWDDSMTDHTSYYLDGKKGLYRFWLNKYHGTIAERDQFIELVDESHEELISLFGKDKVKGFVWPWGDQQDEELQKAIEKRYESMRVTGDLSDSTAYATPTDRMHWSYNSNCFCLTEETDKFIAYPDNGKLQFYCFGIHSHDFENHNMWNVLEDTCNKLGYQPDKYYTGTVDELFAYYDACESVIIENDKPINKSDKDIWITVKGKKAVLKKNSAELKYCD